MSRSSGFTSGDWFICCDRCGFIIMARESKHEYDGLIVCKDCYEIRHPQELIRIRKDRIIPPFIRPEPIDTYMNRVTYVDTNNNCTADTQRCQADWAGADCAIVGRAGFLGTL